MFYRIVRTPDLFRPVQCTVIDHTGERDLVPTGRHSYRFDYGRGDIRAAELALTILADFFDEEINDNAAWGGWLRSWDLQYAFMWKFLVDRGAYSEFEITELQLALFCMAEVGV